MGASSKTSQRTYSSPEQAPTALTPCDSNSYSSGLLKPPSILSIGLCRTCLAKGSHARDTSSFYLRSTSKSITSTSLISASKNPPLLRVNPDIWFYPTRTIPDSMQRAAGPPNFHVPPSTWKRYVITWRGSQSSGPTGRLQTSYTRHCGIPKSLYLPDKGLFIRFTGHRAHENLRHGRQT